MKFDACLCNLPELLAPVSDRQMLMAAIHNGAGAVYLGAPDFNARGRADLLSLQEIGEMIETAHTAGLKVYIALNVLIFEDELPRVLELYHKLCLLRPDAFILQDVGLARLIREIDPGARLHASTQMTVAGAGDIAFYGNLGFLRYTLSRELTLNEVRGVRKACREELEVFVHGSLCIAYSGQCFTSAGFGGRSANRGECAQSCRHEYRLLVGSHPQQSGYLVSPQDLGAKEQAQELAAMGVNALKIEGRLKSPEYVSAALRLYRSVICKSDDVAIHDRETRLTFHRGLYTGWLGGIDHKKLVNPKIKSHRGHFLGKIQKVARNGFTVALDSEARRLPVKTGDGIYIEEIGAGGPLFGIFQAEKEETSSPEKKGALGKGGKRTPHRKELSGDELPAEVLFTTARDFPLHHVRPGMEVFLTSCQAVRKELKLSYTAKENFKKEPVRATLSGRLGEPMKLTLEDSSFYRVEVLSQAPLESAQNRGLSKDFLEKEIGSLGGAFMELTELVIEIPNLEELFLAHGMIKSLRKEALGALLAFRKESMGRGCDLPPQAIGRAMERLAAFRKESSSPPESPRLYVMLRRPEQAAAMESLTGKVDGVYLDFTYGREYAPVMEQLRSYGVEVFLTSERVMKGPGAIKRLNALSALKPDLLLLRNGAAWEELRENRCEIPVAGDFSLNAANSSTAAWLLEKGFERITASYDLVFEQGSGRVDLSRLLLMLKSAPVGSVEVCLSYYLPAFYMEYCLFAAHHGKGGTHSTCGFPCKKLELALQDRKGEVHPVFADQGCRNIMYNSRPKEIISFLPKLIQAGARDFRIEFLQETPEEIISKVNQVADQLSFVC